MNYFIKLFSFMSLSLFLSSCQLGYILENAYHQADIMRRRIPLEEVITKTQDPIKKNKLILVKEAREFAKNELGLNVEKNYSTFVDLESDYVTYVVNAARKDQLESYLWNFPIIGKVPYKGYFNEVDAKKLQLELEKQDLDTNMRGVSAFSTLGWFNDPLLSSMLKYSDYDLVSTVIHESVHATFYYKNQADFNERAATFLGNLGATLFYKKIKNSEKEISLSIQKQHDDKIFSDFITAEIINLRKWYTDNKNNKDLLALREDKFKSIKDNFTKQVLPRLSSGSYHNFANSKLNNAKLLLFETYMKNFEDLELLYQKKNNFKDLVGFLASLESASNPEEEIRKALTH